MAYMIFLVFLTVALVLGVNKSNPGPGDYSQPLDGIRLFCEVMVLLMIIIDIVLEIRDFWKNL